MLLRRWKQSRHLLFEISFTVRLCIILLISTVCPSFISMICPSIFTGLREVCISRNKNVPINVYFTDNFVDNVVNATSDITGHCMIVDAVIQMSEFIGRIVQFWTMTVVDLFACSMILFASWLGLVGAAFSVLSLFLCRLI